MNNRFKFRAWDTKKKVMLKSFYLWDWESDMFYGEISHAKNAENEDYSPLQFMGNYPVEGNMNPQCILMQWTGLTDKTGKEIYEGDILKIDDWEYPLECKWDKDWTGFQPFVECDYDGMQLNEVKLMVIIGNIYENPELVKR